MDGLSLPEDKKHLRSSMKKLLLQLSEEKRSEMSLKVLGNLQELDAWKNADTVLAFLSMKDEIETAGIINAALSEGKKCAVPKIDGETMEFYYIDSLSDKNLVMHSYGMQEPLPSSPKVSDHDFKSRSTLLLAPGLAFDSRCMRLGRGKSFYDRFLSKHGSECVKAGIAFQFQITDKVPSEAHDIRLDFVITEKMVYSA